MATIKLKDGLSGPAKPVQESADAADDPNDLTDIAMEIQRRTRAAEMAHPGPGRISLREIRAAKDDDLCQMLIARGNERGKFDAATIVAINAELTRRATRPHWTTIPGFALLVAAVATAIAGLPQVQSLLATPKPHAAAASAPGSAPSAATTAPGTASSR
jgi:hypothetical protein